MATKEELLKKGKELGLNLNSKMSKYELEHRIKEKEDELNNSESTKSKKSSTKISGEY